MAKVIYDKQGGYTGYLGNIMFQTASTIGIAEKNGMEYVFPHKPEFNYFSGNIPQQDCSQVFALDVNENGFHYSDIVLDRNRDYNLKGYFQSEKYFKHCEDKIRKIFTFKDSLTEEIKNKYKFLTSCSYTLISLHVRRGDYLNHPNCHPVLTEQYYVEAGKRMEAEIVKNVPEGERADNVFYVVFSNDFEWCKNVLCENEFFKYRCFFSEENSVGFDMNFMSMCNHHIIANSTMSWWASWLNSNKNKIIIAPSKDKWFGSEYAHWNLDDLYLNNWILI